MRKFKVKALSVLGRNNRIYNAGDNVDESKFPVGRVDELVEKGFLEAILKPKKEDAKEVKEPIKGSKDKR